MRIMTKGSGRRGGAGGASAARPVSWNVHLTGRSVTGAASKSEQDDALRHLQEQIKKEDTASPAFAVAVTNAATAEQPHDRKPIAPSPEIESKRVEIKSPRADTALSLEDQAEMSAFNAFNEQRELERINKWTRGGGKPEPTQKKADTHFEKPIPAVLMRQFETEVKLEPKKEEPQPEQEVVEKNKVQDLAEYHDGVAKFTNHITVAAKALRQHNSEALVKASWAVILSAKSLAGLAGDDSDIISWTKALEGQTNQLRTRMDSGSSGHEHYSELSNMIGQLYLSVVSLS